MDLELSAVDATIKADAYKYIKVALSGVDVGDLLSAVKVDDIIAHCKVSDILDAIGEDAVKDHFELYSTEDIGNFDSEFENI